MEESNHEIPAMLTTAVIIYIVYKCFKTSCIRRDQTVILDVAVRPTRRMGMGMGMGMNRPTLTERNSVADHITMREYREERRTRILSSIVHKKVVTMIDSDDKITLSHIEELSHRSARKADNYDEEAPPKEDSNAVGKTDNDAENKEDDESNQGEHYKSNIIISATKILASWRTSPIKSTQKISDPLSGVSEKIENSSVESLYSPRTCPICLEEYKEGDDICWSKNKNCPHAFHLDCMAEWLIENDECPMCRENYLEDLDERCYDCDYG